MAGRGVDLDRATLDRWVEKFAGAIAEEARRRKAPTGRSWRTDETYVKVKGKRTYLYPAIDKRGNTLDFMDADEVAAVIHDPEFRDYLETLFLNKGLRVIGAIYNSPTLLLSREPVADLDAFQGLKVRTFASPLQMEPMKMLGANPTPLALSEVMCRCSNWYWGGPVARWICSPPIYRITGPFRWWISLFPQSRPAPVTAHRVSCCVASHRAISTP